MQMPCEEKHQSATAVGIVSASEIRAGRVVCKLHRAGGGKEGRGVGEDSRAAPAARRYRATTSPPPLRWPEGAARPGQLSGATHDLSRALWPFAGARVAHAWPREGSPPERWGGFARGDRAGDREAGAPGPERSLCAAVYTALTLNRELGTKRRWLVWLSPPSLPPPQKSIVLPGPRAPSLGCTAPGERGRGKAGETLFPRIRFSSSCNSTFKCSLHILLQEVNRSAPAKDHKPAAIYGHPGLKPSRQTHGARSPK